MKPELYFEDDESFHFPLLDGLTIGREADVNVSRLKGSRYVSRVHATFVKGEDGWYVKDEGSSNGTFVNSVKVEPGTPRKLGEGDLVSLGFMSFVFKIAK